MLSLLSAWTALAATLMAGVMLFRRSFFSPGWLAATVYTAILSLTLAGVALWALRKEVSTEPGVRQQRSQCYAGIGLSVIAIGIVYAIFFSTIGLSVGF